MKLIRTYIESQISEIKNFKDMIEFQKNKYGNNIAIDYELDGNIIKKSYINIAADVKKIVNYLISKKISDQKIALIGRTSYEYIIAYLAISISNNVCVPIDKSLKNHEILNLLEIGDVKYVFAESLSEKTCKLIYEYCKKEGGQFIDLFNLVESLKNQSYTLDSYENINIDADKVSTILFTSGTTGTSKGVMLSQGNIVSCIKGSALNSSFIIGDTGLSILPINHPYEFTSFLSMNLIGIKMHINDSLPNLSKNLKKYHPSSVCVVPLVLENMMRQINKSIKDSGKESKFKFAVKISTFLLKFNIDIRRILFKDILDELGGRLRFFISGGAPINNTTVKFFKDFGIDVLQGYGISECSPVVSLNLLEDNNPSSVGIPLKNVEVKIINDEICIKSDIVMKGYYKNEDETKKVLENGWFKTGDLGYMDDKGHLFITGRKKNLIILDNGKNVYPEELEEYLQKIDGILEVAVYESSKMITAEIFKSKEVTESEIREAIEKVNTNLPIFKNIQNIKFRDYEFEKTSTKKIKRHLLNQEVVQNNTYIEPRTILEKLLCKSFEDVLQVKDVGIKDNFFEIGGDSLAAVEITLIDYDGVFLDVTDIYKHPTVEELALNITEKKKIFQIDNEINELLQKSNTENLNYNIKGILLTGATGFLGSHILYELSKLDIKIYCLIRSREKFNKVMNYYFSDIDFTNINLIIGDIEKQNLGIDCEQYKILAKKVDTVIHVAANVKHAEKYDVIYKTNVIGTNNILDFCRISKAVLHHTSTVSLHGSGIIRQTKTDTIFNEKILNIGQQVKDNVYIDTKYQAEKLVIKARNENIKSNIYRIGNLTWRKRDLKFQFNNVDNGFINRMIGIMKISASCKDIEKYPIDFTPVDECAQAYVKLVMSKKINNIYHLFNPNILYINDIARTLNLNIKHVEKMVFEQLLRNNINIKEVAVLSFYYVQQRNSENIQVDNSFTINLLKDLDFEFSQVNLEYLSVFK